MFIGRSPAALTLAVALIALTACGTRWTDAQRAEFAARSTRAATEERAEQQRAAERTAETSEPGAVAGSSSDARREAAAVQAASQALPCAARSTEIGVTDDTITVGSISSLTGPVPGLGATAAAAVRAYVDYRNATGGVCGRRVDLKRADDGTDLGRYRAVVGELAKDVLGIAGGFAVGDIGGGEVIAAEKLPLVNVITSHTLSPIPTVFDIDPDYAPGVVAAKYRYFYEHGVRRAAVVYIAIDQSRYEQEVNQRLMKAAGIQVVNVQEVPLSTLSFDSIARTVANSGADYLFFIGDTRADIAMAKSMADTGYKLKYADFFAYAYNDDFIAGTGAAGEGAVVWLHTLPAEEASQNKEVATYVNWMERTAPGLDKDDFGGDSWASAKAFFQALEAIPGPISRVALVNQLRSTERFDAGGMLKPIRLGAKLSDGCSVGLHVQNGKWRRLFPATGFAC